MSDPPREIRRTLRFAPASKLPRLKILTLGPARCGKSKLVKRYCEGKFVNQYVLTVGIDYGVKPASVNGRACRVNFWDTSGLPQFRDTRVEFFDGVSALLLVFDVTNQESFDALPEFLREFHEVSQFDPPMFVVGSKSDLLDRPGYTRVPLRDIQGFCSAHGCQYFEVSAQSGSNVEDLFMQAITDALELVAPVVDSAIVPPIAAGSVPRPPPGRSSRDGFSGRSARSVNASSRSLGSGRSMASLSSRSRRSPR